VFAVVGCWCRSFEGHGLRGDPILSPLLADKVSVTWYWDASRHGVEDMVVVSSICDAEVSASGTHPSVVSHHLHRLKVCLGQRLVSQTSALVRLGWCGGGVSSSRLVSLLSLCDQEWEVYSFQLAASVRHFTNVVGDIQGWWVLQGGGICT
jgi:hypothetical protein